MGTVDAVLGPEFVLPEQLRAPRRAVLPEHQLLLAVLEQALRDLDRLGTGRRLEGTYKPVARIPSCHDRLGYFQHRARQELIAWFSSDATDWITDFAAICEQFDLDPDAVRTQLVQQDWRPAQAPLHIRTGGTCIKKIGSRVRP